MKTERVPDVVSTWPFVYFFVVIQILLQILVKKLYTDSNTRARKRKWKLRHIEAAHEMDTDSVNR
jgi:hypothetical protein